MWVLAIMLLPLLLPMIVGMVLAIIFTRPRSDILALLASSLVLLGFSAALSEVQLFYFHIVCSLVSGRNHRNTDCGYLSVRVYRTINAFHICEMGVEVADYFRSKHHPPLRRQSKGNLVLVVVFFVATLAQLLPMYRKGCAYVF